MSVGDWIAFASACLTLIALLTAFLLYLLQRSASKKRDIDGALAMLAALRGMLPDIASYLGDGYSDEKEGIEAGQDYFKLVMKGDYGQVFRIPLEPLIALIDQPGAIGLLREQTIEATNLALWRISIFNQYAQQQMEFNTLHHAEILDQTLSPARRDALLRSGVALSQERFVKGIGDVGWYGHLKDALDANIKWLRDLRKQHWWEKM